MESLAAIHCTVEEIASVIGVHKRTLERRCAAIIKKGREKGKASLRRMQYDAAKNGSTAMMIWLGKQLLGQKDKPELYQEVNNYIEAQNKTITAQDLREILKQDPFMNGSSGDRSSVNNNVQTPSNNISIS